MSKNPAIDQVDTVRAGKFRRYPNDGLRQILDLSTMFKNVRDIFYVILGILQSYRIIHKIKPDIVFSRGGYVSVPVCLGAKYNSVEYITHDSDSIASLANRIISKGAIAHFVATAKKNYRYPEAKTVETGIPLSDDFKKIDLATKTSYRQQLGYSIEDKIILVIGGGQGARDLNNIFTKISANLLKVFPRLKIIHIVGRQNYKTAQLKYKHTLTTQDLERVKILDYSEEVYLYSGAADLIITRAGATNLAEFAVQGKACIVIPSSFLASNHQVENAKFLADNGAVLILDDKQIYKNSSILYDTIANNLMDEESIKNLENNISRFSKPRAAHEIAKLILSYAKKSN